MSRVRISQPRPDCVVLEQRPDVRRAVLWALPTIVYWLGFRPLELGSPATLAWVLVGVVLLPLATVRSLRALKRPQHTLVRTAGRLLLDGEPLELARVELRVRKRVITKVPVGYDLSLWVMTAAGPLDLPLGRYRTLIDASRVSGDLEEFVQRANNKQHKHV
ncbi:MAG: hypothetical protein AB1730_23095 [Myxococcota bacterium]|jgi:hypothetical protein